MKIDLKTAVTIGAMVVSVTVSHMNLKGRIDVLEATNTINHGVIMKELGEIKTATTGNPLNGYADESDPLVKKKKAYAGTPEGMYYEEN